MRLLQVSKISRQVTHDLQERPVATCDRCAADHVWISAASHQISPVASSWGELGAAMLEAALVIPLFVLLTFGILDIAPAIHDYLQLTQVTHEALRTASATPSLSPTKTSVSTPVFFLYESTFDYSTIPPTQTSVMMYTPSTSLSTPTSPVGTMPQDHFGAHERAAQVVQLLGLHNRLQNIRFLIGYDDTATADSIQVTVQAEYRSFLGVIFNQMIPLTVSERGPYLY